MVAVMLSMLVYLIVMASSWLKVSEPARYQTWGLAVDRRDSPREFVVYRYPEEGWRHTEPFQETARAPFTDSSDAAVSTLTEQARMPAGIARLLLNQLAAKLASHRSTAHTLQD